LANDIDNQYTNQHSSSDRAVRLTADHSAGAGDGEKCCVPGAV